MNNTVLLSGKGTAVHLFFLNLLEKYPKVATLSHPRLHWWQITPRHELRLQNLSSDEILALESVTTLDWSVSNRIKIQVF